MQLEFHGASQEVTGSAHIIEANGARLLLDCGLHQGRRKEAFELNRTFTYRPEDLHNVVLSHAHIDHSGNLPQLTKNRFRGRIVATRATKDLCEWLLRDSAHIQEKDVEYVNKKRARNGQRAFEPLYTVTDAERCLSFFDGIPYEEEVSVGPGVKLMFEDAGHILGSAVTHLDVTENGRRLTVVYSGDVGRSSGPILRDPVPPRRADVLICECTYGDRLHDKEEDTKSRLGEIIADTRARGGKVLIPAFSVGRTQTVVYYLHQLFDENQLPPIPIFVDSPLSANATDVYRSHPECYDEETMKFFGGNHDPFGFERLTYVRDLEESKTINDIVVPCVIISASGMMESGRILHHLKRVCVDRKNTVLLVGFMAENTLGRRIQDGAETIRIFGEEYPMRARVESISGLSGHADRNELTDFLGHLNKLPAVTFLIHGEPDQAQSFAQLLRKRGFPRVEVPVRGQKFTV